MKSQNQVFLYIYLYIKICEMLYTYTQQTLCSENKEEYFINVRTQRSSMDNNRVSY